MPIFTILDKIDKVSRVDISDSRFWVNSDFWILAARFAAVIFVGVVVGGVVGLVSGLPDHPKRNPFSVGVAGAGIGYVISISFGLNLIGTIIFAIVGSVVAVTISAMAERREQRKQLKAIVPDQRAGEVSSPSQPVRESAPKAEVPRSSPPVRQSEPKGEVPSPSQPVRESAPKGEVPRPSQPVRKHAPTEKIVPSVRAKAVASARIFINYRREDGAALAGRIYDRLEREFGHEQVFMDVDAIRLGANYVTALNEEVAKCDVMIALIGRDWFDARDEAGHRRLDNPNDFVRIEIAAALQRQIRVIPILVDGTKVPKVDQLPPDIQELALRQGLEVRHASFKGDIDRLVRELKA